MIDDVDGEYFDCFTGCCFSAYSVSFSAWLSTVGHFGEGLCRSRLNYALPVGGQQYIRILYPELIIYITEQSVLFMDSISQTMFLDIAKLVDGFPCLC